MNNSFFKIVSYASILLMQFSRKVALGIGKAIQCKRVGMSVIGLEVPHVHVHLIPLQKMEDASFQKKSDSVDNGPGRHAKRN